MVNQITHTALMVNQITHTLSVYKVCSTPTRPALARLLPGKPAAFSEGGRCSRPPGVLPAPSCRLDLVAGRPKHEPAGGGLVPFVGRVLGCEGAGQGGGCEWVTGSECKKQSDS